MKILLLFFIITVVACILFPYLLPGESNQGTHPPTFRGLLLFGTYEGENFLVTVLKSGWMTLKISLLSLLLSILLACIIFFLAFWGRRFSSSIFKVLIYFPRLFVVLLLVAILDLDRASTLSMAKEGYLIFILGGTGAVYLSSQLHPEIMGVSQEGFVHFARSLYEKEVTIFVRHILPNCSALPLILAKQFRDNILFISTLTFLGCVTLQPEELGGLISKHHIRSFTQGWWWLSFFPSLFLFWFVMLAYQFTLALSKGGEPR